MPACSAIAVMTSPLPAILNPPVVLREKRSRECSDNLGKASWIVNGILPPILFMIPRAIFEVAATHRAQRHEITANDGNDLGVAPRQRRDRHRLSVVWIDLLR